MTFLAILVATSSETLERRPALSAVCRQIPTREPCCGRKMHDDVVKFDMNQNLHFAFAVASQSPFG